MTKSEAALLATLSADLSRIIERQSLKLEAVQAVHRDPKLVKLRSYLNEANRNLVYAANLLEELADSRPTLIAAYRLKTEEMS